ncbi:hypothetical protein [Lysobacter gummosus]|uniref:hypothetical protein n=1 Tax=Lysobacter gummosus TaxID=262324 RepID=UPI0036305659
MRLNIDFSLVGIDNARHERDGRAPRRRRCAASTASAFDAGARPRAAVAATCARRLRTTQYPRANGHEIAAFRRGVQGIAIPVEKSKPRCGAAGICDLRSCL